MSIFGRRKDSPSQNPPPPRENPKVSGTDIVRQNREIFNAPPSLMEKYALTRNGRKKVDGTLGSIG